MPAQIGILQHVFGIGPAAQHAIRNAEQPASMDFEFRGTGIHDSSSRLGYSTLDGRGGPV
jgi:hypothetical protein